MWGNILHFFLQKLKKICNFRVTAIFFPQFCSKWGPGISSKNMLIQARHREAVTREIQIFFIFGKKNVKPHTKKTFLRNFFQSDPSTP